MKNGTLKAAYYYGSAYIIIDNVYGNKATQCDNNTVLSLVKLKLTNWIKKKKNQFVYSTWHGSPLKKIGRDQHGSCVVGFECPNTTMIFGDRYTLDILSRISFNKIKCELIGFPRNDILHFNNEKKIEMKKKLKLPLDKNVLLFAPTFRTERGQSDIARSGINQLNEMNFDLLFSTLKRKFGNDWVIVCRFHYHVEKYINWNELKQKYNGMIINGNDSDEMSEYLLCADILLSDLSSCLFDFMITEKPAFSYFPDYDYYSSEERGLYYPMEKLPFPFSKDFDGLIKNIENFNIQKYIEKVQNLEKKFEFKVMPNATEKVVWYIMKERNIKYL